MQPAHGTLVHDGQSLDGQEYRRGDSVAIVDTGADENLRDTVQILNLRSNQYILVLLKAVCWLPTHTEQRSGTTFLLTLYGPNLDFRHPGAEFPHMGYRGIATLFGSSIYVGREVILDGNPSRVNLDPTERVSLFTAQWDALSISTEMQQPALTPSASSCASSRSPSEAGDDVPQVRFYRRQGRRDSAIEIRDPESPVYKSSVGQKLTSPKPYFNRAASFATRRIIEEPKILQHGNNSGAWSDLGSDDGLGFDVDPSFNFDPTLSDNLDLCFKESRLGDMFTQSDLQVNFVFMPQHEGGNYAPAQPEQERPGAHAQEPLWAAPGMQAGHDNTWNTMQMPPQPVPEMRQQQLPDPQQHQQQPQRSVAQPEYYEQYRLADDHGSSQAHARASGHLSQQVEGPSMYSNRSGYLPSQQHHATPSHPIQNLQMQPRFEEQSVRPPAPNAAAASFPTPQEVHIIQSNRPETRLPYSLPSSSYTPVQEGSLPSTIHSQQPRRSPLPEDSRSSSARGTPVMARRSQLQPVYTFTPTGMVNGFRQSTQEHIATLESHCEQLQQKQAADEQLQDAKQTLQAVRRTTDESLKLLTLLQPISGIPFQGTERRLQSLTDQIVTAMQSMLPDASEKPVSLEVGTQKVDQKIRALKDFIEYVEGVHPEVVKRSDGPAATVGTTGEQSRPEGKKVTPAVAGRVPSAPASVSSHVAPNDESDSCRWVDGQATPPPDRAAAAQNRDHSRMLHTANGISRSRPINAAPDFFPPTSYSQPSSRTHSPMTNHSAPTDPIQPGVQVFFQPPLPTPAQQSIPLSEFNPAMQPRPMQPYAPPTSMEMMRPMQPVQSLPSQNYTTQHENPFGLRPPQQNCIYPSSGPEMSQAAYAPRSPVSFHPVTGPAHPRYYHEARSSLPERRTVRQDRPAPYSLNYRDNRRRRGSQ
ncbi:hypothetical protein CCHL11_00578 [Colletotrichum chlorophyti]|uniref:Uncharacterized protein n=1 Tax=Colletotrichum chlorophyti TaxID=708187 RepID=A0A1Q8S5B5_9PEZI|nr:hypothetical protein CCHL11_00578 [Colletotrichum chlorophyti]